ncbi:MAG: hypothetical protein HYV26_01175 [Candidatus Hydrogenedentes bacterium]|nr:hypothetical protein [Candidatus Hydrogenedentota bacterium]
MFNTHLPPMPLPKFLRRFGRNLLIAFAVLMLALGIGMTGYHLLEGQAWLDAFASAAMILSGMGPLTPLRTDAGKLFAGVYALFSGLTFITLVGVVAAPVVHRVLHYFHLEPEADQREKP